MHPYMLETGRLVLRALSPEDAQAAFVWCGDPQVNRFMPYPLYTRVEDVRTWLTSAADAQWEFGFVRREDGLLIGSGGVSPGEKPGDPWEVGYNLRRDCWGQGYATEAARAMVRFAFHTFGIRDFTANFARANSASGGVMRHLGMVLDHQGEYARFDGSEVFPADFYRVHLDRQGQARVLRFLTMTQTQIDDFLTWGYPLPRDASGLSAEHRFAAVDVHDTLYGTAWFVPGEHTLTLYPALCPAYLGMGAGEQFLRACVAFGRQHFGWWGAVHVDAALSPQGKAACQHAGFHPVGERWVLAPWSR
ncbi:MAG: GNAT family N-acetyltransferase [Aristaeellaceae bacterium]